MQRRLGRSGFEVSPLGLGTARIAGLGYSRDGDEGGKTTPEGVAEAKRAIRIALDRGINFFDTADVYGAGRAERILGEAFRGIRNRVVIATKFGEMFDEETGTALEDVRLTPGYVEDACDRSLRRLQTDVIDIYILHIRDVPLDEAVGIRDALEDLVAKGKIRFYGWSTNDVERARLFAEGPHCTAIEHRLNVFMDAPEILSLCDEFDLGSIGKIPLLTGVLTGRWTPDTVLPEDDRRSDWFGDEGFLKALERADSLRPALTRDGRSYVQGAIGWIWRRHPRAVPIPGFRTVEQVEGLVEAISRGPLAPEDFDAVNEMMK